MMNINVSTTPLTPARLLHQKLLIQYLTPKGKGAPTDDLDRIASDRLQILKDCVTPTRTPTASSTSRMLNMTTPTTGEKTPLAKRSLVNVGEWETEVRMLAAAGKTDEAEELCREALTADKTDRIAHRALAETYRYAGSMLKAYNTIQSNFDNKDPVSLRIRGAIQYALNKKDEAKEDLDLAIMLASTYDNALRERSLWHLEREEYDFALRDISAALRINPDNGEYLALRARIYHKKGVFAHTALDEVSNAIDKLKVLFEDFQGSEIFMTQYVLAKAIRLNLTTAAFKPDREE